MLAEGDQTELKEILCQVKRLAVRYYKLTQKPLGVTGEIAEFEAAEKLGLKLEDARCASYDASLISAEKTEKYQIKGRAVLSSDKYRGRVPSINCTGEFDAVLLILLDKESFDAMEIWRLGRDEVIKRLTEPGSKARNERGAMGIAQFKSKAELVWSAE